MFVFVDFLHQKRLTKIQIMEESIFFEHFFEVIFLLKFFNEREAYFQTSSKRNFTSCDECFIDRAIVIDLHDTFLPFPVLERNKVESIGWLADLIL